MISAYAHNINRFARFGTFTAEYPSRSIELFGTELIRHMRTRHISIQRVAATLRIRISDASRAADARL
ncbi:MAG: hypothetical protein WCF20_04045 [Methylovirgula sp.]